jgi:hypothetical protein
MKKFLLSAFLLSMTLIACKKDNGAAFEGSYKGTYIDGGISLSNVVITITDKGDNDLNLAIDLGVVTSTLTATADSKTKFTVPSQSLQSNTVSGTGTLNGTTLTMSLTSQGGSSVNFTGEKQ